jgi:hypothetical protein
VIFYASVRRHWQASLATHGASMRLRRSIQRSASAIVIQLKRGAISDWQLAQKGTPRIFANQHESRNKK